MLTNGAGVERTQCPELPLDARGKKQWSATNVLDTCFTQELNSSSERAASLRIDQQTSYSDDVCGNCSNTAEDGPDRDTYQHDRREQKESALRTSSTKYQGQREELNNSNLHQQCA